MKLDEMLVAISKLYGKELEPAVLAMYEGALEGYGLDDIRSAINQHVSTSPFMPRPAELISIMRKALEPTSTWADSWTALLASHGRTDDAIGARALRALGGWAVVGYADVSRLPWLAQRFQEAYETLAESAHDAPMLPGPRNSKRLGSIMAGALESLRP